MKQFVLGLSVSVAFVVGCVTATVAQSTAVPEANAAAAGGQRWEYICRQPGGGLQRQFDKIAAEMNEFGAQGWEAISHDYCFKRPLP